MKIYGVLVISHGSRRAEWVQRVEEAVGELRFPGVPVASSFLELVAGRSIQDGINRLEAQGVTDLIVLPLFISSGSTHIDEISFALGVQEKPQLPTELQRLRIQATIHFCQPIDDDPEIAQIICAKLGPITRDPAREAVVLIGHGSKEDGFYQRWQQGLQCLAGRIREIGGYDVVRPAMLLPDQVRDQMLSLRQQRPERKIIIAPLFLSEGYFTEQVIPSRLEGFSYRYTGDALLPSPLITRWMEKRIGSFLQDGL